MSFANLYYKRTAGTAKACYVCYKPTTTVLATINTVDFLYTCDGHLADPGFATPVGNADGLSKDASKAISPEEIAKVKAEWEEKQKKKREREKEKEKEAGKEKEKDGNDKDGESSKDKKKGESPTSPKSPASPASVPATPSPPTHQRYTLHRDFFTMRQTEHRRRKQTAQAKELAPRLPGAPSGGVSENKF